MRCRCSAFLCCSPVISRKGSPGFSHEVITKSDKAWAKAADRGGGSWLRSRKDQLRVEPEGEPLGETPSSSLRVPPPTFVEPAGLRRASGGEWRGGVLAHRAV